MSPRFLREGPGAGFIGTSGFFGWDFYTKDDHPTLYKLFRKKNCTWAFGTNRGESQGALHLKLSKVCHALPNSP